MRLPDSDLNISIMSSIPGGYWSGTWWRLRLSLVFHSVTEARIVLKRLGSLVTMKTSRWVWENKYKVLRRTTVCSTCLQSSSP